MADIIPSIKNIKELIDFLEKGGVERILGDVEFSAAEDALKKRVDAIDKRSQVWSVINHLETAYIAHFQSFSKLNPLIVLHVRASHRHLTLFSKSVLALCIMGLCYKYLNEEALSEMQLQKAIDLFESKELSSFKYVYTETRKKGRTRIGLILINIPIALIDMLINKDRSFFITVEEVKELKTILSSY